MGSEYVAGSYLKSFDFARKAIRDSKRNDGAHQAGGYVRWH